MQTASFIAIDEEMTGISLPPNEATPLSKEEMPSTRYPSLKKVPERYSIIQLGVSIFEQKSISETNEGDTASFDVRRYKFTIFSGADPNLTREITLHPSAMHFLQENNMDFDTWVRQGIPFCNKDNVDNVVARFLEKLDRRNQPAQIVSPNRQRLTLTRDSDKEFHARCITRLREWLDAPVVVPEEVRGEGVSLLLPRCNSFLVRSTLCPWSFPFLCLICDLTLAPLFFQRRSLYEAIQRDYPYLSVETENEQIRVWRQTEEERTNRNQRLLHDDYNRFLTETVGVYRIFLALSKACRGEPVMNALEQTLLAANVIEAVSKFEPREQQANRQIPLVGHNCLMDLLFLMTHFHSSSLPQHWSSCKELIHSYFPVIYDTKVLASEHCSEQIGRTHLQAVYENVLRSHPEWQQRRVTDEVEEQAHDAAFDAYMTGVSFCGLIYSIHDECNIPPTISNSDFKLWEMLDCMDFPRWLYGRNKLYFHLSPFTIDLEAVQDPLGRRISDLSTFRVSHIDSQVSTRDILDCVRGLTDSRHRSIYVDIFWVDDNTFLIGARIVALQQTEETFEEHGKILLHALKGRFCSGESIECFVSPTRNETTKNIWNLWGLIGSDPRESLGRTAKRRRLG